MWPNLQETADLITFTKAILHGKLYFFFVQCFFTIRTPPASRYNIFLYAATIKCGFPQGSQFNPVQAFWGYSQIGGGLPKICHTYPTMIKRSTVILCLKKVQKIYESRDTPLELCWHQHFFTGNQQL